MSIAIELMERGLCPEWLVRCGIRAIVKERLQEQRGLDDGEQRSAFHTFVKEMRESPIAVVPEKANEQHYEVPAEFYLLALGPYLKYSGCYWPEGANTLGDAEQASLEQVIERAQISDGHEILELGCGWGSFSLYAAEKFPNARVTSVSNSKGQKEFIDRCAADRGISNLEVLTADINAFSIDRSFDRVVSIEMFEHMRNHELLLKRIGSWLKDDGKLFIHIFCHRRYAYLYEVDGTTNWMGRYFFTGGMMPSEDLLAQYDQDLKVAQQWWLPGTHYAKTAEAWADNIKNEKAETVRVLGSIYGLKDATRWFERWKVFFLACAEMFGYQNGEQWGIGHYLLEKKS